MPGSINSLSMNLHIITGGSRGLGAALAEYFAAQGDDVAEISRTGHGTHPRIRSFTCDLAGSASKDAVIQQIFAAFPANRYEVISLTNNAGMVDPIKHIADLDEVAVARNIAVNLTAPMALTAAFLKHLSVFGGKKVVANISTGVAKRPKGSWAAYSSAKAGLECFSEALAKDRAADDRFHVITFEPGVIDTEMQALIRSTDPHDFDEIGRFTKLKDEGQLLAPAKVAGALGGLILRSDLAHSMRVSVYDLIK